MTQLVYIPLIVALAIAVGLYATGPHNKREPFLPLLGLLAPLVAKPLIDKVIAPKLSGGGGGGAAQPPAYVPTYVGRRWDGADWSCPDGTIETGMDNTKACINGGFHPPVWRWDGKQWSHSCMNGTVPTAEAQWEKKCEAGWTTRILADGKWQCPEGTQDTGKNFDNTTWHEAHKQCKRGRPYTTRIKGAGDKWVCPEFSKDTGLSWGAKSNEWDQCKWTP